MTNPLCRKQQRDGTPDTEAAEGEPSAAALSAEGDGAGNGNRLLKSKSWEDDEAGYYYVRTYAWTPDSGQQEVVLDACGSAEAGGCAKMSGTACTPLFFPYGSIAFSCLFVLGKGAPSINKR